MINDMRLRLSGDTFEVGLGDLSAYFSNYTFNNTLFGVTASLRPSKNVTLSVLAGTNRDAERDTFEHLFYGARVETRPIRQLDLALTYVPPTSRSSTPALDVRLRRRRPLVFLTPLPDGRASVLRREGPAASTPPTGGPTRPTRRGEVRCGPPSRFPL